jgi:transcription elongation factor Elf1
MEERKIDNYPEEGKCPLCSSKNVYFYPMNRDDAGLTYHAKCEDCGAKYDECYDLIFAGNWNIYDKENNKYEDMPT